MMKDEPKEKNQKGTTSRRGLLKSRLGVAVAATLLNSATISQAAEKSREGPPNILFVFSDEHRWCTLPFTQMPEVHAPTLSQLAKEGISFDRCVSNDPICVPYRNMLLTGMWPQRKAAASEDRPHRRHAC